MIGRRLIEIAVIGALIMYCFAHLLPFFLGLGAGLMIAGEVYGSRKRANHL